METISPSMETIPFLEVNEVVVQNYRTCSCQFSYRGFCFLSCILYFLTPSNSPSN